MKHRSFVSALISVSLGVGGLLISTSRAQATQGSGTAQESSLQNTVDREMKGHQQAMADLLRKFEKDFQSVVSSKDANGYVWDKTSVKAFKEDIDALSGLLQQHKRFASDYGRWCGQLFSTDYAHWCDQDKEQNEMAVHQRRMKDVLCELSSAFSAFVDADDHRIDQPYRVEETLDAYRTAFNDFAAIVQDHAQEIAQLMGSASGTEHPRSARVESASASSASLSGHSPLPAKR